MQRNYPLYYVNAELSLCFTSVTIKTSRYFVSLFFLADPEMWSSQHVRAWLNWVLKEFNMEGQVSIETYAPYSGHDLIKMGKTMFCDLSPPNYACDIIWEHLMMLRQGKLFVWS